MIYEDDPFVPDQRIGTTRTDINGYFAVWWTVEAGLVETDFDIYAVFDGDSEYSRERSPNQNMRVLKYGGSITLDPIPRAVAFGDPVKFSGTLRLDGGNTQGAIVYIKDEDPLDDDDLLATAWVDDTGNYTTSWLAASTEEDDVSDIYAVFEGNDLYYRMTTCDDGYTFDFGGGCADTRKMRTYEDNTRPAPSPPSGDGYMELYHSLDFDRPPRVMIAPSSDAYDEVRHHILPIQEGITLLNSMLEKEYPGGNWDVTFEIITPGRLFVDKPDIIVSLVTADEDSECLTDYVGYALISPIKPVHTTVCSLDRSDSGIGATAAHEFIHAMGVVVHPTFGQNPPFSMHA